MKSAPDRSSRSAAVPMGLAVLVGFAVLVPMAYADSGRDGAPVQPTALPPSRQSQGAAIEPVTDDQVVAIVGHQVVGPDGEQIGRLADVLVDSAGVPRAAVLDIGGFLGVGTRTIAVEWKTLRFEPWRTAAQITLEMTLDQIKAMPAFEGLPKNAAALIVVPAAKPPPAKPEPHT